MVSAAPTEVERPGLDGLRGRQFLAVVRTRAFVILGLCALAVAQPLLDLFGKNPEFFVAGNYSSAQIVSFALIIVIVPPAVGIGLVAIAAFIDRRVGTVVFGVVVALLAGAFVLAILRTLDVDVVVLVFLVALVGGIGLALLVLRTSGARLFFSYLAVANLVFVGLFLFGSRTAELVSGESAKDLGEVSVPALKGPVVVIVLDEMPAATIMRSDGTINADRFPGFAKLAATSTWFRNATSQYHLTHRSVPSILDGRIPDGDDLPTYADHPRNLFTLLGEQVPVHRYESVTSLCPSNVCEPPPRQSLGRALEDASIVYGHRVLPEPLREDLPPIDHAWGNFGTTEDEGAANDPMVLADQDEGESLVDRAYAKWRDLDANEKSPFGQAGVLRERIDAITGEPSVHFVHVALPHRPWTLSPSGFATSYSPPEIEDPDDPAYAFRARMEYQLHSMQLGAADVLIGDMVDELRQTPEWKDTLIVVTSDHGTNFTPPDIGRMPVTDHNREEVYRIPLFIKAPGQTSGEVRDESAQTIDVLPSIVDLLGARVDWEFDGHSLFDGSSAHTAPKLSDGVDGTLAIVERRARQFPYGDDWTALAAVGENGDLVGKQVTSFDVGDPSEYTVTLADSNLFADLPTDNGQMPFVLHGTVTGEAQPAEMVAAVNGRIAGIVGGYRPSGGGWTFIGYVADFYRDGANEVAVYEVERAGDTVTLHPAS